MSDQLSKLRVIYIGGAEHNGSTFLGASLGNHDLVTCVGELSELPREGWITDSACACGLRISECAFWATVRQTWEKNVNDQVNSLTSLENAFDRNRRFPHLIVNKYRKSGEFSKYCYYTYELFHAIRQVSGNSVIVDTSKRFSRALALSLVEGIDLKLIHLVRDARGVVHSWTKPYRSRRRGLLDASIRWNLTNGAFDLIRRFLGDERVLVVRFEDLITEPTKALSQIGDFTNLNFGSVAGLLMNGDPLVLGHMGIGNDFLRREKSVILRSKIDWPQKMPKDDQRRVWLLTARRMRYYGYNQK